MNCQFLGAPASKLPSLKRYQKALPEDDQAQAFANGPPSDKAPRANQTHHAVWLCALPLNSVNLTNSILATAIRNDWIQFDVHHRNNSIQAVPYFEQVLVVHVQMFTFNVYFQCSRS